MNDGIIEQIEILEQQVRIELEKYIPALYEKKEAKALLRVLHFLNVAKINVELYIKLTGGKDERRTDTK